MNIYVQRSNISRYQRESVNYLRSKGFTVPDLSEVRKNFDFAALQAAANARTGKSLHELVKEQVASMSYFKLKRGGVIPGLDHYANLKLQAATNRQINNNLRNLGVKARKYYRPFNINNVSGRDASTNARNYWQAVKNMQGKTLDKLLGQLVGSYRGLMTSLVSVMKTIGQNTRLTDDILLILAANERALSKQWTSANPKINNAVIAAAALLRNIEDSLPSGVSVTVYYSSDRDQIAVLIEELAMALGIDPNQYKADVAFIKTFTGITE